MIPACLSDYLLACLHECPFVFLGEDCEEDGNDYVESLRHTNSYPDLSNYTVLVFSSFSYLYIDIYDVTEQGSLKLCLRLEAGGSHLAASLR